MSSLLLFDLDGTLVDSFQQIADAANSVRRVHGFRELRPDESMRVIGLPAARLFDDLELPESAFPELIDEFRATLLDAIHTSNTLYPGVVKFLELARDNGFSIAVATSKPQHLAEAVVANSELAGRVDFVSGVQNCLPKPEPTVILRAMAELNAATSLMFGDRPEDIEAAGNAAIAAIGVAQTAFSESELASVGAIRTFSSFVELAQCGTEIIRAVSSSTKG